MRKWIVIGVVAVVAVIVIFAVLPLLMSGGGQVAAQNVETGTVERQTVSTTVESSGTIAPAQTIYLSFGTSGTVTEVSVEIGDTVEVGAVLARLDTSDFEYQIANNEQSLIIQQANYDDLMSPATEQQIAQAEANLASAQAQLESAQINAETAPDQLVSSCSSVNSTQRTLDNAQETYNDYIREGYEQDATFVPDPDAQAAITLEDAQTSYNVAAANCDSATANAADQGPLESAQASVNQAQLSLDDLLAGPSENDIASAQAQLQQTQLQLDNARAALADAEIIAPFSGVITAVNIVIGQTSGSGSTAITLVDNSTLFVEAAVDELDIPFVEVAQPVNIYLDALEDATFTGIVTRIAPSGETSDGVVSYDVQISLELEADSPLRVGMSTDVEIIVGQFNDALVVPTESIQRDDDGEYVLLYNTNGTSTRVSVVSGQTSGNVTVVTGDLTEGQVVLLEAPTQQGFGAARGPFGG